MKKDKGAAKDWHNEQALAESRKKDLQSSINNVYDAEKKLRGTAITLDMLNQSSAARKVEQARKLLDEAYEELKSGA